jgi:hypothetical protein
MRGFLQPSLRPTPSEGQAFFSNLSRGRRTKLATAAQTTLLKADQWARAEGAAADVSEALDRAVKVLQAKKK